jgi:hypothetical protein
MVRKVSAVLGSLFVMVAAIAVLALPAAADYVPASTTPTSVPASTTPTKPTTPTTVTTAPTSPTTGPAASTAPATAAPAAAAANLAFTGSDSKPLVIVGILAVAVGAVLVVAVRRRSSVQAPKVG